MRALVIDDSRAMRRIVGTILKDFGFEVREAGDGRQALDLLQEGSSEGWVPDLCCIDWNMPVMDGLQFVMATRANPAYRQVTLMMGTTESETSPIVKALAAGAPEHPIKPFTAHALPDKPARPRLPPAEGTA